MVGCSQPQSRGVDVGILAPRSPVSPPGPLFSALRCSTASPAATWSCRHFCLCEVRDLAGSWELGAGSWERPPICQPSCLPGIWGFRLCGPGRWMEDRTGCHLSLKGLFILPRSSPPYPSILSSWLSAASHPLGGYLCRAVRI